MTCVGERPRREGKGGERNIQRDDLESIPGEAK